MLTGYLMLIDQADTRTKFEEIYFAYRKQMFYLARSILGSHADAEDAVHTVFVQIAAKHMQILEKLTEPADMRNYLLKATKNTCLNLLRKRSRADMPLEFERADALVISDQAFLELICAKVEAAQVKSAIATMPDTYREVLYYHFVMELPVADVARLTDRKPGTVKMQLVRGKKKLLQKLKILGGEEDGND